MSEVRSTRLVYAWMSLPTTFASRVQPTSVYRFGMEALSSHGQKYSILPGAIAQTGAVGRGVSIDLRTRKERGRGSVNEEKDRNTFGTQMRSLRCGTLRNYGRIQTPGQNMKEGSYRKTLYVLADNAAALRGVAAGRIPDGHQRASIGNSDAGGSPCTLFGAPNPTTLTKSKHSTGPGGAGTEEKTCSGL